MDPFNIGKLAMKYHSPYFVSCTPLACLELILRTIEKDCATPEEAVQKLRGKRVVVIGRSNIVGMPVSLLLTRYDC